MKRDGTMKHLPDTSLKRPRSAATFALRWMEETQRRAIGKRLWDLRENGPETNRSIGDAVGVSERTVAEWVAGRQGITYDHAKAVSELFEVDLDWFWRGKPDSPAPDVLDLLGDRTTVDQELLRVLRTMQAENAEKLAAMKSQIAALQTGIEVLKARLPEQSARVAKPRGRKANTGR